MRLERYTDKSVVVRSDVLMNGEPDTKSYAKQLREAGGSWNTRLKSGNPHGWIFPIGKSAEVLMLINSINIKNGLPVQTQIYDTIPEESNRPTSPDSLMVAMSGFRPPSPGLSAWAGTSGSSSTMPTFTFPSEPKAVLPTVRPIVSPDLELTPFPPTPSSEDATGVILDKNGNPCLSFHFGVRAVRATPATVENCKKYGTVEIGQWVRENFANLQFRFMMYHPHNTHHYVHVDPSNYHIRPYEEATNMAYDFTTKQMVNLVDGTFYDGAMLHRGFYSGPVSTVKGPFDTYVSPMSYVRTLKQPLVYHLAGLSVLEGGAGGALLQQISDPDHHIFVGETGMSGPNKAIRLFFISGRKIQVHELLNRALLDSVYTSPFPLTIQSADHNIMVYRFIAVMDPAKPQFYSEEGRPVENMTIDHAGKIFSLGSHWKLVEQLK